MTRINLESEIFSKCHKGVNKFPYLFWTKDFENIFQKKKKDFENMI
jgi:hypothetical protein